MPSKNLYLNEAVYARVIMLCMVKDPGLEPGSEEFAKEVSKTIKEAFLYGLTHLEEQLKKKPGVNA